jgi:signal recognition particle GTPase
MIPMNPTKRDLPSELDRIDVLLQNLANTAKNQILVFKETVEGKDALTLSRRRYFEKMAQLNLNLEGIDHD